MTNKDLRGIFLDLDGTLYDDVICQHKAESRIFGYLTALYGFELHELQKLYKEIKQSVKSFNANQGASHSRLLYFLRLTERVGGKSDVRLALELEKKYWETFLRYVAPNPGLHEFLDAVRALGRKIVIISDLTAGIQAKKLMRLKIEHKINFLVTSEESGSDKPATNSFELALHKSGLERDRVVFVGNDLMKDGQGSMLAGIDFILFSPDKPDSQAHKCVRDFFELKTLVDLGRI